MYSTSQIIFLTALFFALGLASWVLLTLLLQRFHKMMERKYGFFLSHRLVKILFFLLLNFVAAGAMAISQFIVLNLIASFFGPAGFGYGIPFVAAACALGATLSALIITAKNI